MSHEKIFLLIINYIINYLLLLIILLIIINIIIIIIIIVIIYHYSWGALQNPSKTATIPDNLQASEPLWLAY